MMNIIERWEKEQARVSVVRPRFGLLLAVAVVGMLVLGGRSFYLQVMAGSGFRTRAEQNRVTAQLLPAPRGIMYDAFGQQLVENISSTDLLLDPGLLPRREDEGYLVETLPHLIPISADEVRVALERCRITQRPVLLAKALTHNQVLHLEEVASQIEGTRLTSSLVRKYPYLEATAHVVGYTGPVTVEDLQRDPALPPTDSIGKLGIEEAYDQELRGKGGISYVEVNAAGKPQVDLGKQDPLPGKDMTLTLDIELQKYIYSLFSDRDAAQKQAGQPVVIGAVVVMNPTTGAVVSLASYPSFDPNAFSQPALRSGTKELFEDKRQPLFNRAISGTYPSGSTVKPFLAAGGLEEGIITETTTVFSTGGVSIGPWHFADWKAGGHGVTDVKKAVAESVNTFFYLLAGGDETHTGLGVERIEKYLREFGWGAPVGIDLPAEAAGFIPNPAWKEQTLHERWYIGDTYHLAIGQGNVQVTPLQIAAATGAVANGKYFITPHVKQDERPQKRSLQFSPHAIGVVQEAMRQTVLTGSGRSLAALPVALAGKTGTAQIGGTENTHAWFTSFGPYEQPTYVVTVLLEQGGTGDDDALPMARSIWEWLVEHRLKAS